MPYSSQPNTSPADLVRAYVGDTNATAPLLDDPTYVAFLAITNQNAGRAAILAARAIAATYAQLEDETLGPLKLSYAPNAKNYLDLARVLASDPLVVGFAAPLAGGITDPTTGDDIVPFFTRTSP